MLEGGRESTATAGQTLQANDMYDECGREGTAKAPHTDSSEGFVPELDLSKLNLDHAPFPTDLYQVLGVLSCTLEALFVARFTFREGACIALESSPFPRHAIDDTPELWLCRELKNIEEIMQSELEPSLRALLLRGGQIPPGFTVSLLPLTF